MNGNQVEIENGMIRLSRIQNLLTREEASAFARNILAAVEKLKDKPEIRRFSKSPQLNFNNSVELWKSYRGTDPNKKLQVIDGHITSGSEVLARFTNDKEAITCLIKAGYIQHPPSSGTFENSEA